VSPLEAITRGLIKEDLISFLEAKEIPYQDFGTHSKDSVDYPDFAHPVASAVENNEASFGILICGSANGVAITANKHQGVRAAVCWVKNLLSCQDFITMQISFVSRHVLYVRATPRKW
jgi:RpiB/LacA/LacB family sugar-phosphate isomerase